MAHPAACSRLDFPGASPALVGIPAHVLRFTSWVPRTAPLFSMPFLQQHVVPTLDTAASGEAALPSCMPDMEQGGASCSNGCNGDLMPCQGQAGPCTGAAHHKSGSPGADPVLYALSAAAHGSHCSLRWGQPLQPQVGVCCRRMGPPWRVCVITQKRNALHLRSLRQQQGSRCSSTSKRWLSAPDCCRR